MLRFLIKNHQLVYKSSFLKFAEITTLIQNTSSYIKKKEIFNEYLSSSNEIDRKNITNILTFVKVKPKTGLATKTLSGFLKAKYFEDREMVEKDIDEIIDMLEDTEENPVGVVELGEVHQLLEDIKSTEGKGSVNRKMQLLDQIMDKMNVIEIKTFLRILNKKLRIGMASKSFDLQTTSQASSIQPDSLQNFGQASTQSRKLEQKKGNAIIMPNIDLMLSMPLKSIDDVWKFCGKKVSVDKQKLIADMKYDGERTLIIYRRGIGVELMSRRKKWQTEIYKSLHASVCQQLDKIPTINSIQIDGQILCVSDTGDHLPMQTLLTKRGKQSTQDEKSKVLIFAFDVIQYNGSDITSQTLVTRRSRIPSTQHIKSSEFIKFDYPDEKDLLLSYYKETIEKKRQGLIIKGSNDLYFTNGSRRHWGKFKKGCKIHGQDTGEIDLDLVVMGVYGGEGKNSSRYSAFLLGVYHQNRLYPVSKVGTGFTQNQLDQLTQTFSKLILPSKPSSYQIPKALRVDHFVQPIHVFKVTCQDLTRSPHYQLKYEEGEGGISLRFPVFQEIRDDKAPQNCTSTDLFLHWDVEENK